MPDKDGNFTEEELDIIRWYVSCGIDLDTEEGEDEIYD